MDKLNDLLTRWQRGAMLLFMLAICLAGGAIVVGVPLLVAFEVFGWNKDKFLTWLLLLSPLWAPIWAGYVTPDLLPSLRGTGKGRLPAGR